MRVGLSPFNAVSGTVDIASIDPVLGTYDYETISDDSNESGVNIRFYKVNTESETNKRYVTFKSVDHNFECGSATESSDCETDEITGYIWNQVININNNTINGKINHSSIVSSYILDPTQELEYRSSDALKVKNHDDSYANGLSSITLGTNRNQCNYSFTKSDSDSGNGVIQFTSCPLTITGYSSSNEKQRFNGAINDVSITFNITDFDNEENLKNDPRFTIERRLYSSTGYHIGYFKLNIVNGGFSVVDLNKNPFTN
ncbi:MAG: hypothetical protein ISQ13_01015 [Candidatus Margulisbacteria bacterium]|nr:hypothetical protein [Candidatus Margulisiibacteriota bacterium]